MPTRIDDRVPWRLLGLLAAAAGVLWFLYWIRPVLTPFFLAAVLAYVLAPAVDYLERQGLGRGWGILLIYALLGLVAGGLVGFVLPGFLRELNRLTDVLPAYTVEVKNWLDNWQTRYSRAPVPPGLRQVIDDTLRGLEARALAVTEGVAGAMFGLVSGLMNLILAPFLAFYLLVDLPRIKRGLVFVLPTRSRGRWLSLLEEVDRVVSGFIRGQLLLSAMMGVLTSVVLALLGMRFAVVVGIITALTEFVPYFGPLIGAVPALALASLDSLGMVVKVLIAWFVLHQIEGAVLSPKIMGESVGLHPLTVIFALLAGGELFGVAGMILAVPVTAVLKVVLQFVYQQLTL